MTTGEDLIFSGNDLDESFLVLSSCPQMKNMTTAMHRTIIKEKYRIFVEDVFGFSDG